MQGQPTLNPSELGIELVGLPTPVVQSFLQLKPDGSVATPGLSNFSRDALALADAGAWRGALSVPPVVDGNLQFNSGFGSVATAYGLRAWANFDGTTTPPTIRASGNVSSITRSSTAQYTINFANSMPDGNYALVVLVGMDSLGVARVAGSSRATNTTSSVTIATGYLSGLAMAITFQPSPDISVAIFR